jgi:TonB family protein
MAKLAVTLLLCLVSIPGIARAQQPSAPFLTGNCATSDTIADPGQYVEQPEKPAAIRRDIPIPPFPDTVHRAGYEGKVVVAFIVEADGRVRQGKIAVVSSTDPALSRWACTSMPKMRLDPARDHGRKVASQVILPFAFSVPAAPAVSKPPHH